MDEDKKKDFFNNIISKNEKNFKLKSRQKGTFFIPADESGNYFDKLFYCGFYLDIIDLNLATFFLKIKEFKTKKEYTKKFISIIKRINPNLNGNIFKFKINYSINFSQCAFSLMKRNLAQNNQSNNKINNKKIMDEENS